MSAPLSDNEKIYLEREYEKLVLTLNYPRSFPQYLIEDGSVEMFKCKCLVEARKSHAKHS